MVKRLFCYFILIVSFIFTANTHAGVMSLHGVYQGKNLYVQNPFTNGEFCVVSVFVNNEKKVSKPSVTAFEIDLSHLSLNTPVAIKIIHRNGCVPKVLNKQVIKSKSRFEYTSVNVDIDAINWSAKGERIDGTYFLQRLSVSNEWEDLEKVEGKSNLSANYYAVISEHNTGLNKYRVKHVESNGLTFYSKTVSFKLERSPITIYPRRVSDLLNFTSKKPIRYAIYNKQGEKLLSGKGVSVNCTSLKTDDHYTVVFDNQKKAFYKK